VVDVVGDVVGVVVIANDVVVTIVDVIADWI